MEACLLATIAVHLPKHRGFGSKLFSENISFDILLSDLGMPQINGYALIYQICQLSSEEDRTIPAIAPAAYAREVDRQQAIVTRFQSYLAKPVDPFNRGCEPYCSVVWAAGGKAQ